MTTISTMSAPMAPRGFAQKAGALVAGTAFAGAAVFGGAVVAPTVTTSLTASVQHDYVLTAVPAEVDSFVASLQNLLNDLDFGTMGQVLGVFSTDTVDISTTSTLATLLSVLNPENVSLDDATFNLLSTDITALLNDVELGGHPLGEIPIDSLIGQFIGGTGADESIGAVLTQLGLGDYVGLLNLPFFGLAPTDTIGGLLSEFLGINANTSINDLLEANDMGSATIASLLGITSEQLSGGWDDFVSGITLGGTIMDPDGTGTLGAETLGGLLTSLLGTGATDVTDATTLTDFLGDLGIFEMLGLS